MKLKKIELVKSLRDKLKGIGYQEIKDTVTGAEGLFIKVVNGNYFLCLGLTISNFYDTKFTGSFYLSKTTVWGATWGDIPDSSYERPGKFLNKKERQVYLDEEYNGEGMVDVWWDADNKNAYDNFIETIRITEPRFLGQKDLFKKIDASQEIKELVSYVDKVFIIVNQPDSDFNYKFLPQNKIDDIPIEWFKAAEKTINDANGIKNVNTIVRLAADAWRQRQITSKAS
jgi:hypothetical protein